MEKEKLLNELSSVCGISSEEYIDILKNMKQKNNCDLTIENINLDNEIKNTTSSVKLLTGIPDIDNLTNGLRTGVHVIAGFRKCCKSTLAINLIYRALNEGLNVCLLSLEMSKIDILNTLISLHSFEVDPKTAITRDALAMTYELDREQYNNYLYSFLSLPGNLIIYTEKDLEDNAVGFPTYSEENLNNMFDKANTCCYEKSSRPVQVLVVDNINCIRVWNKKTTGELAYSSASNYFRKVSMNFGTLQTDNKNNSYGSTPVICLLLSQINRTGGKEAQYNGFYPDSCIAETVNIERDATTIIPIYTNQMYIEADIAMVKLEASRYSKSMLGPTEIPVNLAYGKLGYPIGKINVDENKAKLLNIQDKYRLIKVKLPTGEESEIVLPIGQPLPYGYEEIKPFYINEEDYYE